MADETDPSPSTFGAANGYVTDIAYPRSFVPQVSPQLLRLVAALNGYPPPPEADFDYCELGSASADTLLTLASANPDARFVGIEVNATHVDVARDRASRGAISNVRLALGDFETLGGDALPPFDFIVAHGLWSWVSAKKRAAILKFVVAKLKPGGLFYVSYNALPGWAAVEPLRRLMLEYTRAGRTTTLERAREGVQLAQRLADAGASYFGGNPTAKSMLALMQKAGLPYVVHEYFHADWEPMYFTDVARLLGESDLTFLGQLPLYANVRELAIPPSLKKTAESVTDRLALEGLKDFATNELFRSDVYVKGKVDREASEARFYFESTPFGTLTSLANIKREVRLPFYTLEYKEPVYESILAAIAARATTGVGLSLRPELAHLGVARIADCLQNLALGGQVVPMRPPLDEAPVMIDGRLGAPDGAGYRFLDRYNELVLDEALREEGPSVFASPVTRGGVQASLLDVLSIRLVTDLTLTPSAYGDAIRAHATTRPMPLVIGERRIKDADELARVMARAIDRFRSGVLPKLLELEILAPRS